MFMVMNILWQPIATAPQDEEILLKFDGGYIQTGCKTEEEAFQWLGTKNEQRHIIIVFTPVGVVASYGKDVSFNGEPTAWARLG